MTETPIRALVRKYKISIEILVLSGIGGALWFVAADRDIYERLHDFLVAHEDLELDEVLLALVALGIMGFVFAVRRLSDFRQEARERRNAETDARWLALHDPLTGLPNRRFLSENPSTIVVQHGSVESIAVLAIDLDGFKRINDLIGHNGGDELLVVVTRRLQTAFPDDLVLRMGGDEFLVVCQNASPGGMVTIASSLIAKLCEPISAGGIHVEVGASVGVAIGQDHAVDIQRLVGQADIALYSAKRAGRNCALLFEPRMEVEAEQRTRLERQLREALQAGSIFPHYQPLIDLNTGLPRGFEALARWEIAPGEFIGPDIFVAIAEDAGMILDLTEQMLRHACLDANSWPEELSVAVNLSPVLMSDRLLSGRILDTIQETGLPFDRLELELTESAVMHDMSGAGTLLEELREAGVRVALDDIGRGQSSLTLLATLPFDYVKIDRTFISGFLADPRRVEIVKSILALGRGLGIPITAEGVETEAELDMLRSLDCEFVQGFLLGRPMPKNQIVAYLKKQATGGNAEGHTSA